MRSALVYLLVALIAAPAAGAQAPASRDSDVWRAIAERLQPGAPVDIHLKDGTRVQGQLVQVTADAVSIKPRTRIAAPIRDIPFSRIDQIEARRPGMSPGAKVLIGVGIAGGVLLSMFVALLAHSD